MDFRGPFSPKAAGCVAHHNVIISHNNHCLLRDSRSLQVKHRESWQLASHLAEELANCKQLGRGLCKLQATLQRNLQIASNLPENFASCKQLGRGVSKLQATWQRTWQILDLGLGALQSLRQLKGRFWVRVSSDSSLGRWPLWKRLESVGSTSLFTLGFRDAALTVLNDQD